MQSLKRATRSTRHMAVAPMEESEISAIDATDEILEWVKFKDVDKVSAGMCNFFLKASAALARL